jgi:hypothetical protein
MAKQEHLDVLKHGAEIWNQWRKVHPDIQPNLSQSDLSHAHLTGAELYKVDLSGAKLIGTDLNLASLQRANLDGANLSKASLLRADLSEANLSRAFLDDTQLDDANFSKAVLKNANVCYAQLRNANLSEVDLSDANLSGSNLNGAKLDGAILSATHVGYTIFAFVDLRKTKGLAEMVHRSPSRVELYTIQLPQDGSALHFLRGAGVPDEWINFWRTTMIHPIQYHSVFISYSSKDEILARRLHADLQASGVRCWFAPEDLKIGTKFRQRIDEAIHLQDKLLLLLSKHSIQSTWVENEVEAALEKEDRQQREVLFPICLDECIEKAPQAWAATIRRTRHIGDFTRWTDQQAYQRAFERLLRDLKSESPQNQT